MMAAAKPTGPAGSIYVSDILKTQLPKELKELHDSKSPDKELKIIDDNDKKS